MTAKAFWSLAPCAPNMDRTVDRWHFGSTLLGGPFQEHIREDGLVEAHAYSLLHAVDVEANCEELFIVVHDVIHSHL